jgi:hypothetical protein
MACDEVKVCDFPAWEMIDQIEMMAKVRASFLGCYETPSMCTSYSSH